MLTTDRDVGFLRYWQPQHIPLFIIAIPLLFAMFWSTYWVYTLYQNPPTTVIQSEDTVPLVQTPATLERTSGDMAKAFPVPAIDMRLLVRFTVPQTLIALTCLFMVHVQIITRLSSSYPLWYWWMAVQIIEYSNGDGPAAFGWRRWMPWFMTRWIILYGVIQAGLYALMLPPA